MTDNVNKCEFNDKRRKITKENSIFTRRILVTGGAGFM